MNSKQRRSSKRKYKYPVDIGRGNHRWTRLLEITKWLRTIQGSVRRPELGKYEFSNEQDAIMFGLRFSGQ